VTGKWDLEPELAPSRSLCHAHGEMERAREQQARLVEEYRQEELQIIRGLAGDVAAIKSEQAVQTGILRVFLAQQSGIHIQGPQSSGQTVSLQVPVKDKEVAPWSHILGALVGALAVLGCLIPGAAQGAVDMLRGLIR
jgi:hypothetical protein